MNKALQLNINERRTFRLHLAYSIIDGLIQGALVLNEFVFIKSLKGSSYQLSFLFQFSVVVLIFGIFFNELVRRTKRKRFLLKKVAVATHLPLLTLLFFPHDGSMYTDSSIYHLIFLAVFFLYFLSRPLMYPTINLLLKNNYRTENFGKLYSYSTSVSKISMLVSTFALGIMLDWDNYIFIYTIPVLAILGVLSVWLLTNINLNIEVPEFKKGLWNSIKESVVKMLGILRKNGPFRDFQMAFMLYGFAFMSTKAVITIFYDEVLHLNYTSVAFYQNSFNILAIALLPVSGRIIGNMDPRKFTNVTFISLALYLFFIGITQYFQGYTEVWGVKIYPFLMVAIVFNGIFVATMSLAWYIGSAYFCKKEEAGDYQSIHVSLTGFRGLFSPLIGVTIYEFLGFSWTFGVAIFVLAVALILLLYSIRTKPTSGEIE